MRLLSRVNGVLSLTPDLPAKEPYAILSHTWGKDEDEVTFQDILEGNIDKLGFEKIDFCLTQAAQDGYTYVWVDTCCIDKRDRNELGKAINLMYDYYRDSAVCYVYLSDVQAGSTDITNSRWFTRGWTLQELIAPKSVRFFAGHCLLGDRSSLHGQIKAACGIDVAMPLEATSVVQRYRWSLSRQTREPEDQHYCLIGLLQLEKKPIFNYGEGAESSRERLFEEIEKEHGRRTGRDVRQAFLAATSTSQQTEAAKIDINQVLASLFFPNMDARRAAISNPLANTYTWLLTHSGFEAWYQMRGQRFLWIKGKPGAGKSTIIKYADSLSDSNTNSILHISYYFNARGTKMEHCALGMYQSLLYQLLRKVPGIQRQPLANLIGQSDTPLSWTIHSLQIALQKIIKTLEQPVRCFVDALDEGETGDVQAMVWFLQDLTCPLLYVCFASRHYPTVTIRHSVEIVLDELHSGDIKRYVDNRLDAEGPLRDMLRSQILAKANGIFLWAVLVVQILNKELREGSIFDLENKLRDLPPSLVELFESILTESTENDDKFRLCLHWVLFSEYPMSGTEFYYAMEAGLKPDCPSYSGSSDMITSKHAAKLVSSSSRGLAEVSGGRVQIIHESVREYLLSETALRKLHPEAQGDVRHWIFQRLKHICRDYISAVLCAEPPIRLLKKVRPLGREIHYLFEPLMYNYSFLDYAARKFIEYAEKAAEYSIQEDAINVLDEQAWLEFYDQHIRPFRQDRGQRPVLSLMHVLATYDAAQLIQQACALQKPIELAGQDSPLFRAIEYGSYEAAIALIDGGADLEARNHVGMTPLIAELDQCGDANLQFYTHLLQKGADPEACCKNGDRPLFIAIQACQDEVVKILVDHGADVANPGRKGQTALIFAISKADPTTELLHTEDRHSTEELLSTLELLIEHGADVNQRNSAGDTALLHACRAFWNPLPLVQLLLKHGANATLANYRGRTAIMEVIRTQSLDTDHLVRCILRPCIDVNAQDVDGRTALLEACRVGNLALVKLLIAYGAKVTVVDHSGRTVLLAACDQSDNATAYAMARVALEAGAGAIVNVTNSRGFSPLTVACLHSNAEMISVLLEHGADRDATLATAKKLCICRGNHTNRCVEQRCRNLFARCDWLQTILRGSKAELNNNISEI